MSLRLLTIFWKKKKKTRNPQPLLLPMQFAKLGREREMETVEGGEGSGRGRYALKPTRISCEDILFCIDVDTESLVEMKTTGPSGRPLTRLECIKQAILFFINAKLSINPDHRFAFATLAKSASWVLVISLNCLYFVWLFAFCEIELLKKHSFFCVCVDVPVW